MDRTRKLMRYAALAASAGAALAVYWALASHVPREAAFMAAIFVLAALLWVTEALPLFATALAVIGLEIVLLANPGGWTGLGFASAPSPDFRDILAAAADPVLVLFFGGLLMAQAAVKEGVDRSMSALLLRPFGEAPAAALAGVMAVTALFSMFMSNTATASMMLALVAPMLARMPKEEPFRVALVLGVAFAANVGGMGTPIGSPPNAVAMGHLRAAGMQPGFLEWMLVAVPLAAACLAAAWGALWMLHRPRDTALRVRVEGAAVGARGWFVVAVFTVTVLLWLSDRWHGLPASVVALVPAVALTATRTLIAEDLNRIDWSVLILIAGGIALGAGMTLTGLDRLVVQALPLDAGGLAWLVGLLVAAALLLSTFMSNTAAANLLLPIGIAAAATFDGAAATREVAMSIALAAALAMALPVSTPPNALAYSRGAFAVRAMVLPGVLIGIAGATLVALAAGPLIRFWARVF
ncbi:MAG TPA: DASS family sodium-coupled anion symporter [Myxococcota bacterium]|nr:DASS family sodium-coupled anion symporter [Myxococcota bacterium]